MFDYYSPNPISSNCRFNILTNLKIITFLIIFNFTTLEAYHHGAFLILSALANAAHRPIATISQQHSSSVVNPNRKFLDAFEEKKFKQQIFVAEAGEIGPFKEDEVFDQREFVRIAQSRHETLQKYEKRVYSTVTKHFECYSCMSMSYQDNWEHLQYLYTSPKTVTNRCNEPNLNQKNILTVLCGSACVSLVEPNIEAGVFLGYKYMRGCIDKILHNGFNKTAIHTHRFHQVATCRNLPRGQLFNPPRGVNMPIYGEVQLCSCFGDRCNAAVLIAPSLMTILLLSLSVIYCQLLNRSLSVFLDLRW